MNRSLTIICFAVLLLLVGLTIETEMHRPEDFTVGKMVVFIGASFLSGAGGLAYCGFAALHAAQRITDPRDRAGWLLVIIPLTLFGACFYLTTKYQNFRKVGKGSLIRDQRQYTLSQFIKLSHEEENRD